MFVSGAGWCSGQGVRFPAKRHWVQSPMSNYRGPQLLIYMICISLIYVNVCVCVCVCVCACRCDCMHLCAHTDYIKWLLMYPRNLRFSLVILCQEQQHCDRPLRKSMCALTFTQFDALRPGSWSRELIQCFYNNLLVKKATALLVNTGNLLLNIFL